MYLVQGAYSGHSFKLQLQLLRMCSQRSVAVLVLTMTMRQVGMRPAAGTGCNRSRAGREGGSQSTRGSRPASDRSRDILKGSTLSTRRSAIGSQDLRASQGVRRNQPAATAAAARGQPEDGIRVAAACRPKGPTATAFKLGSTSLSARGSLRAKASGHQEAGVVTTVTNQLSLCDGAGGECRPEVRRHDVLWRAARQRFPGPLRVVGIMIPSRRWPLTAARLAAQL